ncbi:M28 family metallopeptidase [Candidatus Arthromitus sp. SFB-rat-Yit]|uniref:M28 family metallopeptidase n=1 Tax=Candidatus Arthromitus sp. SFB-rat-Yit TaxID=1041504 RepID=UPI00031AFA02|nr:M28 family peptidase [Candidatus Arthromitus sp. SFB-rat-Yit]
MNLFKRVKLLLLAFVILFSVSSCVKNSDNATLNELYKDAMTYSKVTQLKNEFNETNNAPTQNLDLIDGTEKILQILTSEDFKGRGSDTDGNDKTVEYLNSQFSNIGLDYLFKDTYLHKYKFTTTLDDSILDPDGEKSNVIGLIKGTKHNEKSKAVVITAHFDHVGIGIGQTSKNKDAIYPGAVDNASGTAALLRIAYKLKEISKETPFETDIIIAAVNHEELGYVGSIALVNDIKDRYENIYNINMDCIGIKNGSPLIVYSNDKRSPELSSLIFKYMDTLDEKIKKDTEIKYYTSDQVVFEKNGMQTIALFDTIYKNMIHQTSDTVENNIDVERLNKLVDYICEFLKFNDKNTIVKKEPIKD